MSAGAGQRRRQITQVAMGLFARQGFGGTTTRHIAEPARVSEVIIFATFRLEKTYTERLLKTKCHPTKQNGRTEKTTGDQRARLPGATFPAAGPRKAGREKCSSKHGASSPYPSS